MTEIDKLITKVCDLINEVKKLMEAVYYLKQAVEDEKRKTDKP